MLAAAAADAEGEGEGASMLVEAEGDSTLAVEGESMLAEAEGEGASMLVEAEGDSTLAVEGESMLVEAEGDSTLAVERESMLVEAEGDSTLAVDGESMLEAEGDSTLAADGRGPLGSSASEKRERICFFRDCTCCWEYLPRTHLVAPGSDYVAPGSDYVADAADHRPAWSLLVGVTDGDSSLRVSRLRVAQSGRILGRSDDVLEVFHNILVKPQRYFEAGAALAPNGRSLCVLGKDPYEHEQQLNLELNTDTEELPLPLPKIEGTSPCIPISAYGHIWALSATLLDDDIKTFSVVMKRLVSEPGGDRRWEHVGGPFTSEIVLHRFPNWRGDFLQGYAVLPDNLILVSFQQYGLFFTFAPESGTWTQVLTNTNPEPATWTEELTDTKKTRLQDYLPILGRGIYMEQLDAVYMLYDNTIYAYKLTYDEDDQGKRLLKLDPPIKIDYVCPFIPEKGYGFLARLGCLMCSVWISLAWRNPCPCHHLHAIVTTFHLRDLAEGGIKVLHSTYRRIDMVPNPRDQKFCFLQEYKDEVSLVLPQHEEEQDDSSKHVGKPSKMLSCCSFFQKYRNLTPWCFICGRDGHVARKCSLQPEGPSSAIPPFGPIRSVLVPVKPATTTIKEYLFIICQTDSGLVPIRTGGDGKSFQLCYFLEKGDQYWHLFQNGSKIHVVSSVSDAMLEFSNSAYIKKHVRRPTADPFVMVTRVGRETIALTDTLQVFHQTQFNYGRSTTWLRYTADESDVVGRRIVMTGYVVVNDDSFIVCDAVTCSCLLFDLGAKKWHVVMPWAAFKDLPMTILTNGVLNGRCVFVDGFVYTCRNGGLAAYELLGEDHSFYLSKPIFLPFTWHADCLGQDMCLDYAGKDLDSGASLFHVAQGGSSLPKHKHGVQITTVKVSTQGTVSNKMEPTGIDHGGTLFVPYKEAIAARCCLAVS